MMQIRYSAMFNPQFHSQMITEFLLSLSTVEQYIAPYNECEIILYTLDEFASTYRCLFSNIRLPYKIVALDADHEDDYERWTNFTKTIEHCTDVDRMCVVRMLADTALLDVSQPRLLLGTDVYFFDKPVELLDFIHSQDKKCGVLYMVDAHSVGEPYKLKFHREPILGGLVGDFYCLAPGVTLMESEIVDCLNMIDAWPTSESRWVPALMPEKDKLPHHACEQQASAILLKRFGGIPLCQERYSHIKRGARTIAVHTHDFAAWLGSMPIDFLDRFSRTLQAVIALK